VFGRKKKRQRQLAEILESDAPHDRLVAAIHGGAVVVVDGDAVAGYGWPQLSVDAQRKALVDFCGVLVKQFGADSASFTVFLDATMSASVPRSKVIAVEVADDRTAAAERAIEEIEDARSAVAVWSDANAVSLRAAGAALFRPDDLLDGFLDLGT